MSARPDAGMRRRGGLEIQQMGGEYVAQKAELIVDANHFIAEVIARSGHQHIVEIFVEQQRLCLARDDLLVVIVAAEHRETHGECDGVNHDVNSSLRLGCGNRAFDGRWAEGNRGDGGYRWQ